MADPEPFRLMDLAPELRNRIYSFALVKKNTRIDLSARAYTPPALLSTSRLVRKEASVVFYSANEFTYKVHCFRGRRAVDVKKVVDKYQLSRQPKSIHLRLCNRCKYIEHSDLLWWLQAYHADLHAGQHTVVAPSQTADADKHEHQTIARRMFGVVAQMKRRPWTEVANVLDAFFGAVEMLEECALEDYSDDDSKTCSGDLCAACGRYHS